MTTYFDLSIISDCNLQISDSTQNYNQYLPDDSNEYITAGRFKYRETYTINVIKYVSTTETEILTTIITPHVDEHDRVMYLDEACYKLFKDGHYIIEHIILPNLECALRTKDVHSKGVYATDGQNFYVLNGDELKPITIEDLLEVDIEGTSISKSTQETFSLCILNNKYLELCKQEFTSLINNACPNKQARNLDIDLVWMAINAIKYSIEFGMLTQAQAMLEEIFRCTGIAKLNKNNKTGNHGCKCCL